MRKTQNLKPWPKGVSGNPGGRHKIDLAAEVARLAFEGMNLEEMAKALRTVAKRNPRMFQVLADRAYGKLTIQIDTNVSLHELSDGELEARLARLREEDGRPSLV